MPRLFVWDYHGTLCTGAEEACVGLINHVLEEFHQDKKITLEDLLLHFGKPWGGIYKGFLPDASDSDIKKMVDLSVKISFEFSAGYIKPNNNVHFVFRKIKEMGDSNVIVSSTEERNLRWFIRKINIDGLVDHYIGIPEIIDRRGGSGVAYKARKIMEFSNGRFPEIIMTGDRETDVRIGRRLNATTFRISRTPVKSRADFVISDLKEVLRVYD